jgi:hypothetical protein
MALFIGSEDCRTVPIEFGTKEAEARAGSEGRRAAILWLVRCAICGKTLMSCLYESVKSRIENLWSITVSWMGSRRSRVRERV